VGIPLLELRDVRKVYGGVTAVDRVSLTLARGEFVSLLGPSGSGKTTTLQMIAGLVRATSGEIRLDGREVTPLPPYKRNIGMVFQNYALFPHLTVARNIAFPLEMRSVSRTEIDKRVADALRLVDLPGYGERYPRQLSGGQQQRVALARAIVFEPNLLLMDEPLGALDKKLREQMQIEIKHLHQRLGVTIIYVTHDQDEALVMSDRIAVFNAGRIEQIGTPDDLYERPRTRFVAEFIGESNVIPATMVGKAGPHLVVKAGSVNLQAAGDETEAPGTPVLVSLRPERLRISQPEAGADRLQNSLSAKVIEVIYMGRMRKYLLSCEELGIQLSALVQVSGAGQPVFVTGDAVSLTFEASDARILAAGPA
jgi:putative spermidine/putrescine transport system ATP-binding protein